MTNNEYPTRNAECRIAKAKLKAKSKIGEEVCKLTSLQVGKFKKSFLNHEGHEI
jgi:hypothetical protein